MELESKASVARWSKQNSADLYLVNSWGKPYFSLSDKGEVEVTVKNDNGEKTVSLMEIATGLHQRGMEFPILLRFEDILTSRIKIINEAFLKAMKKCNYNSTYRGVFPIKVNQQQQVIQDITTAGRIYHHGLEVGSKAELIAGMAYLKDPKALLICNGYKDEEFIDLALRSRQLGLNTVIVLEMPGELDVVIERAEALGVQPVLGIRVRLSAEAEGHWKTSGGDHSMFGLDANQIIDAVDRLRTAGHLDWLQLLHYHLGSQIPNIRDIRNGVSEAARMYSELLREGANMQILDIGGGLAVDYDGSHTNFGSSCNYTIDEYCYDIVEEVQAVTDRMNVPNPIIVSESGRSTASYYSVLLFNILDVSRFNSNFSETDIPKDSHILIENLLHTYKNVTTKKLQECYNDALYYRDEIRSKYLHEAVSLREKALAEKIFWGILTKIESLLPKLDYVPDELKDLSDTLSDIYYGNFSVFQSLPDIWGIDQLFPVMPIHRLNERPTRRAIIGDITCDCDGKINRFIGLREVKKTLLLHELEETKPYILGTFLVGAYQETLGDLHNLMGDTHVVSLRLDEDGEMEFSREIEGDSVADVLSYLEYTPKEMIERVRKMAERAVSLKLINTVQRKEIMKAYQDGMRGYTYYEEN